MIRNKYRAILEKERAGFSLIEVILALGIFLVTVLAMVGLLGPTLASVDKVEKTDEVVSVVNTVNAFLQSSPDIGDDSASPPVTKFEAIYEAILADGFATIFVFRQFTDGNATTVGLQVGFGPSDAPVNARLDDPADFSNAAGPIYRVVLTPSPVIPETGTNLAAPTGPDIDYRSPTRTLGLDSNGDGTAYELRAPYAQYAEGYFAMEVRIYSEDPPAPGQESTFFNEDVPKDLDDLADLEPLFTYNTAVLR